MTDVSSITKLLMSPPPETSGGLLNNQKFSGLLGYKVRSNLFDGERSYFQRNPHVAGMAAETGDVILNPFSPPNVNHESVARNEALRLLMRDRGITPSFETTPEQRSAFAGTAYGGNDDALKQTIAARIYSGDPSSRATQEQRNWVEVLLGGAER